MSRLKKIWRALNQKSESLSEEELRSYEAEAADDKMNIATKEVAKNLGKSSYKTLYKILLSVLLITSIVIFATSFFRYAELKKREDVLEGEIEQIELEIDELQYLIGVPKDDYEYMVRVAKEKLGLYFPDETIYYNGTNK